MDTTTLGYVLGTILLFGFAGWLVKRVLVHKDVRASIEGFPDRFISAIRIAKNPDVREGALQEVLDLQQKYFSIVADSEDNLWVNWSTVRKDLASISHLLRQATAEIEQRLAFIKEAKEKGPGLWEMIPQMLQEVQKELTSGKQSPRALQHLEDAQTEYAKIAGIQASSVRDWVTFYERISVIHENLESARDQHWYANSSP